MKDHSDTEILRLAAFSDGSAGGNPAGVVVAPILPSEQEMQRIAAEVGYSETVFAAPDAEGWRVRYFSPEAEVAFCGHATVALGSALAERTGDMHFPLILNTGRISVEASQDGNITRSALTSPPTHSTAARPDLVLDALALFDLVPGDLNPDIPPGLAHAGNDHLVLALADRGRLARITYDLSDGARLMRQHGLTTINLLWAETPQRFHSRNAFAIGGVLEDPATGAAAAALSGYLRDIGWPHGGAIDIVQGEDMGAKSLLHAEITDVPGAAIRVSGTVRRISQA